uniref:Uncharacterized protein n=1 Tax=uncultured marine virus TaxID=186617 RepID=A0A0F7L2S1_9VIRU|nr:hypothetical protein [uncultured marine virus]
MFVVRCRGVYQPQVNRSLDFPSIYPAFLEREDHRHNSTGFQLLVELCEVFNRVIRKGRPRHRRGGHLVIDRAAHELRSRRMVSILNRRISQSK